MVYPGHPSRGCEACRSGKVKCDEGRPSCGRCSKKGTPCIFVERTFRSMNGSSALRSRKRLSRAPKPMPSWNEDGNQAVALTGLIPLAWANESIGPFFDRFLDFPDALESTWGFQINLPALFGQRPGLVYLDEAIKCCALANMANVSKIAELEVAAGDSYRKALASLATCLHSTPTEMLAIEETLSAMLLLIEYEALSGTQPPKDVFNTHFEGQRALIRQSAANQNLPLSSKPIVAMSLHMVVMHEITRGMKPSIDLSSEWVHTLHRSWLEEARTKIDIEVAVICHTVQNLESCSERDCAWEHRLEECSKDVMSVCHKVETCTFAAPSAWKHCTLVSGSDDFAAVGYNEEASSGSYLPYRARIDSYPSGAVCQLWNFIRCAYISLLLAASKLEALATEQSMSVPPQLTTAIDMKMSDTIHDICGSVAYLTGTVRDAQNCQPNGGYNISALWTLQKVCSVPGLSIEVKTWILGVLRAMGTTGGIRHALNAANHFSRS